MTSLAYVNQRAKKGHSCKLLYIYTITLINNGVERTRVINGERACRRVICTANSFP